MVGMSTGNLPSSTSEACAASADLLEEARNLLSSLSDATAADQPPLSHPLVPRQTAQQPLDHCFRLARSLRASISEGLGPPPDSPGWIVVKSVVELVVRWGVYPNLSEGVGIPLHKRFKHGPATAAAAAALSAHAVQHSAVNASVTEDPDDHCTFFRVSEFLASTALSDVAGGLRVLLLTVHLPDIFAAYLQLCYGPLPSVDSQELIDEWRKLASNTTHDITSSLPVGHVVEALLILLHQRNPEPPPWLKSAAGRLLSRAVMRDSGLAAVLERLVGGAEARGNSKTYAEVANHLARSPKYVASADEYFKKICPQIQPLLLLHLQPGRSPKGESALIVCNNIQQTAVMIACSMAKNDQGLLDTYLLEPLLEPLTSWAKLQYRGKDMKPSDCKFLSLTEKKLVECFLQVQVLLTAGHRGANLMRQLLFQRTHSFAPLLLKLHYLLQASSTQVGTGKERLLVDHKNNPKSSGLASVGAALTGVTSEILKARESETTSSNSCSVQEEQRLFEGLKNAVAEFIIAYIAQPAEQSLSVVWALEEDNHFLRLEWPTSVGEIAGALDRSRKQPSSVAMFLSHLILVSENWLLALSLVSKLVRKLALLRKDIENWMGNPGSRTTMGASQSEEMLSVTNFLEIVVDEVGAKAIEEDIVAAVSFVIDLMKDATITRDDYSAELVLHIVHRLVCGLGERDGTAKQQLGRKAPSVNEQELYRNLLSSVESILLSSEASDKVKAMSNSLQKLIVEAITGAK